MPIPELALQAAGLLSSSARRATSSAIRDLLVHARKPGVLSLAGGLPAPTLFPLDRLAALAPEVLADPASLQYGLTEGEVDLREWVAQRHRDRDGRAWSADSVQIVSGSQQGLDLLARVLLDPGDPVVVSDPEYLGAIGVLRQHQARLLALPVDEHGLDVAALEDHLRAGLRPKFCYVIPEFHNPTGASLSPERLVRLAELAERYGFLVVEDNPYGELRFEGTPLPSLATTSANVVQLRTVSKTLAPGLRVAWVVGPAEVLDAIRIAKQSADLQTSTLAQKLVAALVGDAPWYDAHLRALGPHYRQRRDALTAAVGELLPNASFVTPQGGMFLWVDLGTGIDTTQLLPLALESGVAFVPGAAFAVERGADSALRLSFATARPDELGEGVRRLAAALGASASGRDRPVLSRPAVGRRHQRAIFGTMDNAGRDLHNTPAP